MNTISWMGHSAANFLFFAAVFYFFANSFYAYLLTMAWWSMGRRRKSASLISERVAKLSNSSQAPAVSVLIPAFNEEVVIVESVKAYLSLRYPTFEIIVINDGSHDQTLERLKSAFQLETVLLQKKSQLSTTEGRQTFRSVSHPQLIVIDKPNTGKADSLNSAIDFAQHEIFCAVDADSIPEQDAISKTIIPFLDYKETLVSGGSIRVLNGCTLSQDKKQVHQQGLSKNFWALFQSVEYVRAFFCARVGWNYLNSTVLIPGAFGLFNKHAVIEAGGYAAGSVTEDFELVVRLHRIYREYKREYRISFLPDPVCWTQVPESYRVLYEQRRRWQRGLVETVFLNFRMLFNYKYGAVGLLALPYHFIVEVLGPVIELLTILAIVIAYVLGFLNFDVFLFYVIVGLAFSAFAAMSALWIEDQYHTPDMPSKSRIVLGIFAVFENFGFRQMMSVWRTLSLVAGLRKRSWRQAPRLSFSR